MSQITITYKYNSGWVVEMTDKVLIFDYIPDYSLDCGDEPVYIEDYAGKSVYVFISHFHHDHFSRDILEWDRCHDDIHFIFGWNPHQKITKSYIVEPHSNTEINDLTVCAFDSTDEGVAFYIKTSGKVIYHAGDLAQWSINSKKQYLSEMDKLKELEQIDIAFMPLSKIIHAPENFNHLKAGFEHFMRYINPHKCFMMHNGVNFDDYEWFYNKIETKENVYYPTRDRRGFVV